MAMAISEIDDVKQLEQATQQIQQQQVLPELNQDDGFELFGHTFLFRRPKYQLDELMAKGLFDYLVEIQAYLCNQGFYPNQSEQSLVKLLAKTFRNLPEQLFPIVSGQQTINLAFEEIPDLVCQLFCYAPPRLLMQNPAVRLYRKAFEDGIRGMDLLARVIPDEDTENHFSANVHMGLADGSIEEQQKALDKQKKLNEIAQQIQQLKQEMTDLTG